MKSVLISIQPKWCELIASGKKTVEIRKTKPKLETPFKVYIYATEPRQKRDLGLCLDDGKVGLIYKWNYDYARRNNMPILSGKVIGEFVCNAIISHCEMANADIAEIQGRIKREKLLEYSNGKELFGWHISDLVIYDKPKELSEFKKEGFMTEEDWLAALYPNTHCHYEAWAKKFDITKPPQSWCYVEERR